MPVALSRRVTTRAFHLTRAVNESLQSAMNKTVRWNEFLWRAQRMCWNSAMHGRSRCTTKCEMERTRRNPKSFRRPHVVNETKADHDRPTYDTCKRLISVVLSRSISCDVRFKKSFGRQVAPRSESAASSRQLFLR